MNLKELAKKPRSLDSGHRMCPGCGLAIAAKNIMKSTDYPLVVSNATGCLEVSTTIYPYSAWNVPWIHIAFENAAAGISGVETAYRALKKQEKIPGGDKEVKFVAFAGDGGTYDIGLQSLSGAAERGHDFAYFCLDNEGYMNTGIQRSSATPMGADTKTTPSGKVERGKREWRKDIVGIMESHHMPYVAQTTVWNWKDMLMKAKKAIETPGPAFVNVLCPCVPGWNEGSDQTINISKLAVETNFWPLYEIEDGQWKLNHDPEERKPIEEFLKTQKRFRHLFSNENRHIIIEFQKQVDEDFARIKAKSEKM
ncbi:MAG: thiamine pyrophosphate-dependent enzyme [Candidatus Woesearchaeota archaeon]